MRNKILALLAVAALSVGLLARPGSAATDSWSGKTEKVIPFSQALTLGTTAVIATAVTSKAINVRAITITNSASGVVRLYNTSDNSTGANLIGAWGVIANTPLVLSEDQLGQGIITTVGSGLYVDAATGTVSITARVRLDPVSPR